MINRCSYTIVHPNISAERHALSTGLSYGKPPKNMAAREETARTEAP